MEAAEVVLGNPPIRLTLSDVVRTGDSVEWITATLDGPGLHATRGVYDPTGLAEFVAELAASWRGWEGTREWGSLEGELKLSCSHDGIGEVTCKVRLGQDWYVEHVRAWEVQAALTLDPGMLAAVASSVREFLR